MILRPYQTKIIDQTRTLMQQGNKSILIQSPTGSGKTALVANMLKTAASKGKSSLFIVHRRELLMQSIEAFRELGMPYGIIASGFRDYNMNFIKIASIQTLKNRLDTIEKPDLIAWDECHHCASKSYKKVREAFPNAYHIGLSATPERLDHQGLNDCFSQMVHGPTVQWLIDNGFLSPYKIYAPKNVDISNVHIKMGDFDNAELSNALDTPKITGDAINEYKKLANGKRAIVRGVSIKHSKHIAEQFNQAGISCIHLDGETPTAERDKAMESFRRGETFVLSNVDLFSEGVDVPAVECIIDLRPTMSLVLWLQFCGRALRPFPGKSHAIIIDHASNSARHGFPCDERKWTLEGKPKRKKGDQENIINIKTCPKCFFALKSSIATCPECNYIFEVFSREVKHVEGDLIEIDIEKLRKKKEIGMARTKEELLEIAKRNGYKNGWVYNIIKARQKKKDQW